MISQIHTNTIEFQSFSFFFFAWHGNPPFLQADADSFCTEIFQSLQAEFIPSAEVLKVGFLEIPNGGVPNPTISWRF